jgi:alanine racemase
MNLTPRPTRAEIELAAIRHNFRQACQLAGPGRDVLAVVKADAYGHGAVPVAATLAEAGAKIFGVALVEEGCELRAAGITGEILVFGMLFPGQEEALIEAELTPFLFDLEVARRLNRVAVEQGVIRNVHLKLDTGMGRVGFLPGELPEALVELKRLAGLRVTGVLSHFALADDLTSPVTASQRRVFREQLQLLAAAGFAPDWRHISNSAGLIGPELEECNLVRQGISLYGGYPGPGFEPLMDLRPALALRTVVAQVRTVPPGSGVSYGHRFVTQRETRLAVLPVGYADGYNRLFTNRGRVIVRGHFAPVVGTVCMDWILADVTEIPEVLAGDVVTLLGEADGLRISAEEWADQLGTINYEVFCRIGQRVPRVYF